MEIIVLSEIFIDNAKCLSERMGIPITRQIDKPIHYIVFGGHINPFFLIQLQERCKCKFIVLNSEHHNSTCFINKYYLQLLKDNYVFDYLPDNIIWLKETFNINVLGYFYFEFTKQTGTGIRPIDILFIGSKSDERQRVETKVKKQNPYLTVQFIYPDKFTDITKLLLSSKSVLNIPYYNNNVETHRINQAMACGCNVVSYKFNQMDMLYQDYITFTNDYETMLNKPKKNYSDFIDSQQENIYTHFIWAINMIIN